MVDLLRFLSQGQALAIGADAVRTGLTSVAQLEASLAALSRRAGVHRLRSIVSRLAADAHSVREVDLHAALRRAGFSGWVANHSLRVGHSEFRLDVAFPAE